MIRGDACREGMGISKNTQKSPQKLLTNMLIRDRIEIESNEQNIKNPETTEGCFIRELDSLAAIKLRANYHSGCDGLDRQPRFNSPTP